MRLIFFALLAVNIALAAYAWLRTAPANPDADLVHQQLNADKIRIIAARPMVAPVAQASCLEWGPFGAAELRAAQSALNELRFDNRVTTHETSVMVGFWVYIPPLTSKTEVDRKIKELEKLGVREYYAVEAAGPMHNAISLGIFKTEEAALNYLERLRLQGVRSARAGSREHRVMQTVIAVREPNVALTAKLAELRLQFPGTEIKAAQCAA